MVSNTKKNLIYKPWKNKKLILIPESRERENFRFTNYAKL